MIHPIDLGPVSVGDCVRSMIANLDTTQDELAKRLKVSRLTINQLCTNRRTLTVEMALKLEGLAFKPLATAEKWLAVQTRRELWSARRTAESRKRK